MDETWKKEDEDRVRNVQIWTCKICGLAFTSTDKQRYGTTIALNKHIRVDHRLSKAQRKLGMKPFVPKGCTQPGAIDQFVSVIAPIPSAEEAVCYNISSHQTSLSPIENPAFRTSLDQLELPV
jgi:hypothetical protein